MSEDWRTPEQSANAATAFLQRSSERERGLEELTSRDILLVHACTVMEVNGDQSVENLRTSAITPSPSAGASEVAPNHGGGGLEVLGQAVESKTITPSKAAPAETAPAQAPTAAGGSSAGTGDISTFHLISPGCGKLHRLLLSARAVVESYCCTAVV